MTKTSITGFLKLFETLLKFFSFNKFLFLFWAPGWQCSRLTAGRFGESCGLLGIKPRLDACEANVLPTVPAPASVSFILNDQQDCVRERRSGGEGGAGHRQTFETQRGDSLMGLAATVNTECL